MIQVFPFECVDHSYSRDRYIAISNIDEVTIQKVVRKLYDLYDVAYHLVYNGEIIERKNVTISKEATYTELDGIDQKYIKQLLNAQAAKDSFIQFVKEIE